MNDVLMQRLLQLARHIDTNDLPYSQQTFFNECGTPACIAGYASQDPVFQQGGLGTRWVHTHLQPVFGKEPQYFGVNAMQQMLDLTDDQALYIFGTITEINAVADYTPSHNAAGDVVSRIEDVIQEGLSNEACTADPLCRRAAARPCGPVRRVQEHPSRAALVLRDGHREGTAAHLARQGRCPDGRSRTLNP